MIIFIKNNLIDKDKTFKIIKLDKYLKVRGTLKL